MKIGTPPGLSAKTAFAPQYMVLAPLKPCFSHFWAKNPSYIPELGAIPRKVPLQTHFMQNG
jgi:hypothetical protein